MYVTQVDVPTEVRALTALERIDYGDAFQVDVGNTRERTAEQWARAILEGAPSAGRTLWVAAARAGLLPRTHTERSIVGCWEIRRSTPELTLLAGRARSGLSAEMIFTLDGGALLWATLVEQTNPFARALWAGLAPVHRRVARNLLERAARRANSSGSWHDSG